MARKKKQDRITDNTKGRLVAFRLKDSTEVALLAGDSLKLSGSSVNPYYNYMVLSETTTDVTVRRFLLSAPMDARVEVKGFGSFLRSDLESVFYVLPDSQGSLL